ncbi:hypothetical protein FB45DRAFT_1103376 [Roridomyces roridus]|uniref:DUF6534 domain-containing protein n=1 Tax=Roridomyces roridus TaxID=1738132 RepID=A0AAD7BDT9_9AGAR|nr:hypothetical protein FB45DRAFT_1103376 [Roridomyces roridus]
MALVLTHCNCFNTAIYIVFLLRGIDMAMRYFRIQSYYLPQQAECPQAPTTLVGAPQSPLYTPPDTQVDWTTAELFGMFFNYALMGALSVQVYRYYCSFPNDRVVVKVLVFSIFAVQLLETGMMSYAGYTTFGSGYGTAPILNQATSTWLAEAVLPSLVITAVQFFYAYRLYSFSGSRIIRGAVILLSVIQLILLLFGGIYFRIHADFAQSPGQATALIIGLSSSAACDLLISVSIAYYLRRGYVISTVMHGVVSRLVRYTIETGALPAFSALSQIFLIMAFPRRGFFEGNTWVGQKLYANSLLALLNARAVTVGGRHDPSPSEKMAELDVSSRA